MTDSDASVQNPALLCLRCKMPIQSFGIEEFRVGGTTGGWKLVFGELAELGEGKLGFEVLGCPACRHIELRVPLNS